MNLFLLAILSIATPVAADECFCDQAGLPEVLAVVGEEEITLASVDKAIGPKLAEERRFVSASRANGVEYAIDQFLLRREAKREGVTPEKFYFEVAFSFGPDAPPGLVDKELFTELRSRAKIKKVAKHDRLKRDVLVATVDGEPIKSGDVEDDLSPVVLEAQRKMHALRKAYIENLIVGLILKREAKAAGMTAEEYLRSKIPAAVITEADVRETQKKYPGTFKRTLEQDEAQIREYLAKQHQKREEAALAAKFLADPAVQFRLPAPPKA